MKKILAVLMASALIAAMPVTNVFAEETENAVVDIVDESSGTVKLTAYHASKYTVLLPTSVDVSTSGQTFTIQAKGDVDSAMQIVFTETGGAVHSLQDDNDSNNKVSITYAVDGPILGSDVSATYNSNKAATVTITHGDLTAGSYTCNLPITIALEEISKQ